MPSFCKPFGFGPKPAITRPRTGQRKDGKWHPSMLFSHLEFAEFSPVKERDEVYRLCREAREALGFT